MGLAQSWDDIRDRYVSVQTRVPWASDMLALVDHIASSKVADCLFPWTSMFDLCITQTRSSYSDTVPFLRISPKADGKIEFRYVDTYVQKDQWFRVVEPRDANERFDKFVNQLHWLVKTEGAA